MNDFTKDAPAAEARTTDATLPAANDAAADGAGAQTDADGAASREAGEDSAAQDQARSAKPDDAAPKPKTREELEKSSRQAIFAAEGKKRTSFGVADDDDATAEPDEKPEKSGDKTAEKGGKAPATLAAKKAGKEDSEDVTAENARKRIKDTQHQYHQAREEISRLEKRIKELEAKATGGNSGDGNAEATAADPLDGVDLSEGAKKTLSEMPEFKELLGSVVKKISTGMTTEAVTEAKKALGEAQERSKAVELELSQHWESGVKAVYPDFQDVLNSLEFKDWTHSHPATVSSILGNHEKYDPEGAIRVIRAFESQKSIRQTIDREKARSQDVAARPGRTKQGVSPEAEPRKKSIPELEREARARILREESQKRRSF